MLSAGARAVQQVTLVTDQVPEEGARLAEVAYRTWQRERGVPGDAHWEAMPPAAQGAWRATAMAVLEAAAPAIRAAERERIITLAESVQARYRACTDADHVGTNRGDCKAWSHRKSFADLLRSETP